MATGSSHADVALLLVDARSGVKEQTRRHLAILQLVGVQRVILAVNKMDLAGWSQERFAAIEASFRVLAARLGFLEASTIPVSAVLGDNVARRSENMPWYAGPPLLEVLRAIPARGALAEQPFRFPVQLVVRDGADFRGLAGTVTSGRIAVGDAVFDAQSGRHSRLARIVTMDRDLDRIEAGQAATLQLETDLDLSRGAVLATVADAPKPRGVSTAALSGFRIPPSIQTAATCSGRAPISSLSRASRCVRWWIWRRSVGALRRILVPTISPCPDRCGPGRGTRRLPGLAAHGQLSADDAATGATVAGGIVDAISQGAAEHGATTFKLTRAVLNGGLCADLGNSPAEAQEMRRARRR